MTYSKRRAIFDRYGHLIEPCFAGFFSPGLIRLIREHLAAGHPMHECRRWIETRAQYQCLVQCLEGIPSTYNAYADPELETAHVRDLERNAILAMKGNQ